MATKHKNFESLSEIIENRAEINAEFSKYFKWSDKYPWIVRHEGSAATPPFKGFRIMGDGPGVNVTDPLAIVDVELLLNVEISATQYCQFELQGNVEDARYGRDYLGYFNTNGGCSSTSGVGWKSCSTSSCWRCTTT